MLPRTELRGFRDECATIQAFSVAPKRSANPHRAALRTDLLHQQPRDGAGQPGRRQMLGSAASRSRGGRYLRRARQQVVVGGLAGRAQRFIVERNSSVSAATMWSVLPR